MTRAGVLKHPEIVESSGLAASRRDGKRLWTVNDSGNEPRLFAFGHDGESHGMFHVKDVKNVDWEDLASFRLDGKAYLLIADVGDNDAVRSHVSLYVIEEPAVMGAPSETPHISVAWHIHFTYPDEAADSEAVAVDECGERVLVMTKRTLPPRLYELPLRPESDLGADAILVAKKLGPVVSLPSPSPKDLGDAPVSKRYHWQPTAMDIASDGSAAVILTNDETYYYPHRNNETWLDTLNRKPYQLPMPGKRQAEAITFANGQGLVFVTTEKKHTPLLRFSRY